MKSSRNKLAAALVGAALVLTFLLLPEDAALVQASTWQHLANPGALSRAHSELEGNCAACHTPVVGADRLKCVLCHATDQSLLERQPTAFHASITSCVECHGEHRGFDVRPTSMDHEAIARIGLRALEEATDGERSNLHAYLRDWTAGGAGRTTDGPLSRLESVLSCETCHLKEDRHFALFGTDCGACHSTAMWTLPAFRHPSPQSRDCAQCHQAPPSHYMGHFKMISAKIADKPHATVDQCFECHRTTAWTDIPGVGTYKHH